MRRTLEFRSTEEKNDWLELHTLPRVEHPVTEVASTLHRSAGSRTPGSLLPWREFLGPRVWGVEERERERKMEEGYQETLRPDLPESFTSPTFSWWEGPYREGKDKVFSQMGSPCVNVPVTLGLIQREANPRQRDLLTRLLDTRGEVPTYNRTKTSTGRMIVTSGPDLTTLRRDLRSQVLQSRWGSEGSLWELDFNALEPRVLLSMRSLVTKEEDPPSWSSEDLYTQLQDLYSLHHQGTPPSRDDFKQAVISTLYGSTLTSPLLAKFLNTVFLLKEFREHLVSQRNDLYFGLKTTNYYGRPIWEHSDNKQQTHTLINHLVQSTAVDVAIFGFGNIIERLGSTDLIRAVAVIHDAIWFDVHNSVEHLVPKLCLAGSKGVPGLAGGTRMFPMKAKRIPSLGG